MVVVVGVVVGVGTPVVGEPEGDIVGGVPGASVAPSSPSRGSAGTLTGVPKRPGTTGDPGVASLPGGAVDGSTGREGAALPAAAELFA